MPHPSIPQAADAAASTAYLKAAGGGVAVSLVNDAVHAQGISPVSLAGLALTAVGVGAQVWFSWRRDRRELREHQAREAARAAMAEEV